MAKDRRITAEIKRLNKIYEDMPEANKAVAKKLIENAAFMSVNLQDLQDDIIQNGIVIKTMSGNGFEITKENPSQKMYATMIGKYAPVIKQLNELLPAGKKADAEEIAGKKLAAFIGKGREIS